MVVVVVVVSSSAGTVASPKSDPDRRRVSIDQRAGGCCEIETDPSICFLGDQVARFQLRSGSGPSEVLIWRPSAPVCRLVFVEHGYVARAQTERDWKTYPSHVLRIDTSGRLIFLNRKN